MKFLNYFFIISLVAIADLHSMELAKSWYAYYIKGEKNKSVKFPELPKDSLKQIFEQLVNRRDFENENDVIDTLNSFNLASKNANLAVKEFLNEKAQKDPKYKKLIVAGGYPTKTISKLFTQLKLDVIDKNFIENINKFFGKFPFSVASKLATIQFRSLESRDYTGKSVVGTNFKDIYNNRDIDSAIVLEMLENLLKSNSGVVFKEILPLSDISRFVEIDIYEMYKENQELTDLNKKLSNLNKYEQRSKLRVDTLNLFTKYNIEKSLKESEYKDLNSKIKSIKSNLLYMDPTTSPTSNSFFGKLYYPNYIFSVHGLPKTIILLRQIVELLEKIKMHEVKKI